MAKSTQRKEYDKIYRNAKAKERRLKNNHNVSVDMNLLTPTEWQKAPNKQREIKKLERFTDRNNRKYDYVSLGKESVSRKEYNQLTKDSKLINNQINYHKNKTLKRVLDLPYMVYNESTGKMLKTDEVVNERTTELRRQSMKWQKDSSMKQGTVKQLKQYQAKQKRQLKDLKEMTRANQQRTNYIEKLGDFSRMFKGTSYNTEYKAFMKQMKSLSIEDYEAFYYLTDLGAIDKIRYINDAEIGTPEGQEKIYNNMKAIQTAMESVKKLISS